MLAVAIRVLPPQQKLGLEGPGAPLHAQLRSNSLGAMQAGPISEQQIDTAVQWGLEACLWSLLSLHQPSSLL